jgi:hypothetical protein
MNFLRVILIIVIVYYVFKLIGRVVLPWLLKRWVTNMQKRHAESFGQFNQTYQQDTGKVTVKQAPQQSKNRSNEGEYVDFEEVK